MAAVKDILQLVPKEPVSTSVALGGLSILAIVFSIGKLNTALRKKRSNLPLVPGITTLCGHY